MKTKVLILEPIVIGSESYEVSDKPVLIEDHIALKLAVAGQVEFVSKKAYDSLLKKMQKKEDEERAKEAEANAIMQKETLELELRDLYAQVAYKVAQINGVILSDEEVQSFVDEKMQGEPLDKEDEK